MKPVDIPIPPMLEHHLNLMNDKHQGMHVRYNSYLTLSRIDDKLKHDLEKFLKEYTEDRKKSEK